MGTERERVTPPSVYHLAADEQINTLVKVLREATESEVVFVAPDDGRTLRNPVNLRLLAFYAQQDGKSVRIITRDVVIERLAAEIGLPTSASLPQEIVAADAEQARVEMTPARAVVSPLGPRWWHLALIPAFFALLALGTYFAGPRVTIQLYPVRELRSANVTVRIPSDQVLEVKRTVPLSASLVPSGRRRVGIQPARGIVTFINQNREAVKVPAGTEVATSSGARFRTVSATVVPGMTTEYFVKVAVGLRAGRAEAKIVAVNLGLDGNVAAGRIAVVKGQLSDTVQVVNPQATAGGEDRVDRVVMPQDLVKVEQLLEDEAKRLAPVEALKSVPDKATLVPDSVQVEVDGYTPSQVAGEAAQTLVARGDAVVTAITFQESTVTDLATRRLAETLPKHLTISGPVSLGDTALGMAADRTVSATVRLTAPLEGKVDLQRVVDLARGKSRAEALSAIGRLPGLAGVRIDPKVRRLPTWSGRLDVVIASKQ